jgi:hypothetical protein
MAALISTTGMRRKAGIYGSVCASLLRGQRWTKGPGIVRAAISVSVQLLNWISYVDFAGTLLSIHLFLLTYWRHFDTVVFRMAAHETVNLVSRIWPTSMQREHVAPHRGKQWVSNIPPIHRPF